MIGTSLMVDFPKAHFRVCTAYELTAKIFNHPEYKILNEPEVKKI